MELRLRRYRAACFAILALALASAGPEVGWWWIAPLAAGFAGFAVADRFMRHSAHPALWVAAAWGILPLLLAGAVVATGGADQPGADVVRAARGHPRRPLRAARDRDRHRLHPGPASAQHRRPRPGGARPSTSQERDRRRRAGAQHRDPLRRPGRVRPRPPAPLDPRPAHRALQPQRARAAPRRARRPAAQPRGRASRTPCCSATSTTSSGSTTSSATPPATRSCRTSPTRCAPRCAPATRSTGSAARRSSSSCPARRKEDAVEIAERLRLAVRERRPVGVAVTVSIGVAVSRPGGVDTDDLVARADAALYSAKASGRDTVVVGASARAGSAAEVDVVVEARGEGGDQLDGRLDVGRGRPSRPASACSAAGSRRGRSGSPSGRSGSRRRRCWSRCRWRRPCARSRPPRRSRPAARRPSARGSSRGRSPGRSRAGGCRAPSRRRRGRRWRG